MSKFLEQRRYFSGKMASLLPLHSQKVEEALPIFLINSLTIKKQGRIVYLEYGAQTLDRSIGKR